MSTYIELTCAGYLCVHARVCAYVREHVHHHVFCSYSRTCSHSLTFQVHLQISDKNYPVATGNSLSTINFFNSCKITIRPLVSIITHKKVCEPSVGCWVFLYFANFFSKILFLLLCLDIELTRRCFLLSA